MTIFTVHRFYCSQGGGLPQCMLGCPPCQGDPPRRHPSCQGTSPQKEAPPQEGGTFPQKQAPPKKEAPSKETPPRRRPPQEGDPPRRRHPPKEAAPKKEPPPQEGCTPPKQEAHHLPRRRPPSPRSRLRHTVNERPVCILLECILVGMCFAKFL